MKLTLLSKLECSAVILPEKFAGRFLVRGRGLSGKVADVAVVEAVPSGTEKLGGWQMRPARSFRLIEKNNQEVKSVDLAPMQLYRLESEGGELKFIMYAEPLTEDRKIYHAYKIQGRCVRLQVGRQADNDIVYENDYLSRKHMEINITPEGAVIRDLDSANRTYVNGHAVKQAALKNGDLVYLMGLQLTIVGRHLFLNMPDGKVTVRSNSLAEFHAPPAEAVPVAEADEDITEEYYYQAPRFKRGVEPLILKLDTPPANQNADDMPLAMTVGPSITMGMASVATGSYSVVNAVSRGDIGAAIPSMVMSVSMLLGTLMWPIVTRTYQRKQKVKKEELRQKTYKEYLERMERLVEKETASQEEIMRENDVTVLSRINRLLLPTPQIWERTHKHSDFLSLRIGYGDLPLRADIQYSEHRFTMEEDNLSELMYQFAEHKRWLRGVPVCLHLRERYISGFYTDHKTLLVCARNLILQVAALHGYDEVKLVLIYNEQDSEKFSFARYLPHTMSQDRTNRYIATNFEEAKELSSLLDPVIEYRKALSGEMLGNERPYFVILCMDKELAGKTECVRRILEYEGNLNFSLLSFFDRLQDLPKECSAVAALDGTDGQLTLINDVSAEPILFHADIFEQIDMRPVTRVLANTEINLSGSDFSLPSKYTFFEMMQLGMIEHLNLLDQWASNDPTASLAVPIGIDKYGELFKLDLHERAHGPHGLVAGMTGSGKSELIITYILSMASNFHPQEVAFILIDYKGGGMAKAFEHIPHTAGVITNLDGNGIKRSLASMRSELHRRERIFQDVSLRHNVSNIDIYKYQKLYREGKVSEPLPHLLIISDEFAELKKEQPDFMSELTSTARVGRSLGVHLILATQKPGGVVDEQIRSNSRFRVCLKVQDNGDSTEMLGRPEAAALVETGRFYLQVGNNELFELGQSAWAGAPYYASQHVLQNRDDAVSVISTSGRVIAEASVDRFADVKDPPKQLDVVTEYICRISEQEGIKQWKMWLDPIPERIYVDELDEKYPSGEPADPFELYPIVGEYDDPDHQAQNILRVPLTRDGNVIIYGSAGSGKEVFLEAMCFSLMKKHSPREVNFYILDFGAEMLSAFASAPHVGDVILSYETEKVNNLFKLLIGKLETRKKVCSQMGMDIRQYNAQASKPEPNLVVMINNYAAFTEMFDDAAGQINYLTREGVKYGIYFVLTCSGINNVRFSLRQNFGSLYCLQLNSADDYSSIVGKTDGLLPEKYKGRGLFRPDEMNLFEFQVARVTKEEPPYQFIQTFAAELASRYKDDRAASVPVLPERVTADFLARSVKQGDLGCVPVGVEKDTLKISTFDFSTSPVSLVLSASQEWQAFTDALSSLVVRLVGVKTMVFAPNGKSAIRSSGDLQVFTNINSCVQAAREIFDLVLSRNNQYKDALSAGSETPEFEPVFVVIQSMSLLKTMLSRYAAPGTEEKEADDDTPLNRLQLAMEKCTSMYRVNFLVAETLNALTPFTVEGWYKTHITGSSGIWVGGGISTQFRITVAKKPQGAADEIESDFGFIINNATATLIKLLQ